MATEAPFYFAMPEIPGHEYSTLAGTGQLIPRDEWIEGGRQAILTALDNYVRETLEHSDAAGATDGDLPELFRAIDPHLVRLADRINEGAIPGSLSIRVGA